MNTEQEKTSAAKTPRSSEKTLPPGADETLIDLFDRRDREAFRRSLELRDARLLAHGAQRR
jgi:hypothetical protein